MPTGGTPEPAFAPVPPSGPNRPPRVHVDGMPEDWRTTFEHYNAWAECGSLDAASVADWIRFWREYPQRFARRFRLSADNAEFFKALLVELEEFGLRLAEAYRSAAAPQPVALSEGLPGEPPVVELVCVDASVEGRLPTLALHGLPGHELHTRVREYNDYAQSPTRSHDGAWLTAMLGCRDEFRAAVRDDGRSCDLAQAELSFQRVLTALGGASEDDQPRTG